VRCAGLKVGYPCQGVGEPVGEREATRGNSQQHDVGRAVVAFHDLVSDASDGPCNVGRAQNGASHLAPPSPPLRTDLKDVYVRSA